MTCILVRMRPKDVVHSRLYRPFARKEKEGVARERGRNGEERERESEGEIVEKERIPGMYFLMVWVCRCGWRSKF